MGSLGLRPVGFQIVGRQRGGWTGKEEKGLSPNYKMNWVAIPDAAIPLSREVYKCCRAPMPIQRTPLHSVGIQCKVSVLPEVLGLYFKVHSALVINWHHGLWEERMPPEKMMKMIICVQLVSCALGRSEFSWMWNMDPSNKCPCSAHAVHSCPLRESGRGHRMEFFSHFHGKMGGSPKKLFLDCQVALGGRRGGVEGHWGGKMGGNARILVRGGRTLG